MAALSLTRADGADALLQLEYALAPLLRHAVGKPLPPRVAKVLSVMARVFQRRGEPKTEQAPPYPRAQLLPRRAGADRWAFAGFGRAAL
jgi:hypothetical protein